MTNCDASSAGSALLPARSIRLGGLELTLVPDGDMHEVPGVGLYGVPPEAGWRDHTPPDADGFVRVMPNSLLIRKRGKSGGDAVLIDAGGENADEGSGRRTDFLDRLDSLGVRREDVRTLIVTHSHLDHIGYLTLSTGDSYAPAFPNAEVFVQGAEAEIFKLADEERWGRYFDPLESAGLLRVIHDDAEVAPGIICLATPGHAPGHQSVMIGEGDARAIYVGDLAPTKLHLEHVDWHPGWALSRDDELKSKQRIIDLALTGDTVVIFGHDPRTPFGRLRREGESVSVIEEPSTCADTPRDA